MKRRAFTVTELLVVMGIIMGIIATLVVGLSAAARASRRANTDALMNSMVSAIAKFKIDTGYLPPAIGVPGEVVTGATSTAFNTRGYGRDLISSPNLVAAAAPAAHWSGWSAVERDTIQRYKSSTSMAEYLLGLSDRSEDGYGVILDASGALPVAGSPGSREQPPSGIRHPGADGVWGAKLNPANGMQGNGLFASRNLPVNAPAGNDVATGYVRGKRLDPYLEMKDPELLGALVGFQANGTPLVAKPGDANYNELAPKVILDYFGKPIIYYRRGYHGDDPRTSNTNWSLADVFALRPWEFPPGDAVNGMPDGNMDNSTSKELLAAGFALLSFGPDQRWDPDVRRDTSEFNKDNMVRVGQ